mmetsp:Transcript_44054/g.102871  ORF Transcript_44054/g.102871 Transcript_44054/m.102871 type:complete len:284 (-) Transcript_44054:179-1030(-)
MYGGLQRGLAAVKIGDILPIDPQQLITCMEAKQGHCLQDDHGPSIPDDAGCVGLADLVIFSQMPNLCIQDLPVRAEALSNAELLTLRSCQQRILRGHVGGLGGLSWQAEHSKWKPEGLLHRCAAHLKLKRRTFRARLRRYGGTQNLPLRPGLSTAPRFWRVVEIVAPHWHCLRHAKSWTAAHLDQVILVHKRGYRRFLVIELNLYILPTRFKKFSKMTKVLHRHTVDAEHLISLVDAQMTRIHHYDHIALGAWPNNEVQLVIGAGPPKLHLESPSKTANRNRR